jgi:hyperosmotically inducible protein
MNITNRKRHSAAVLLIAGSLLAGSAQASQTPLPTTSQADLSETVRHELALLPFYTIFDNLQYRVEGNTVTLSGQVTRPALSRNAEAVAKQVSGVATVENEIEILPLGSFDNQIRFRVYHSLFNRNSALFRYGVGASSDIRIIVNNGHVTLVGNVSNELDKKLATFHTKTVSGIFSVTNNLQVG